jgi:hypothetical protein
LDQLDKKRKVYTENKTKNESLNQSRCCHWKRSSRDF